MSAPDDQDGRRCGFVALVGAPNVGKSTLLNQLTGRKLSIVTPKVQTTRMAVRGVVIHGLSQVIFVDTPGLFSPRRRLDEAMVASAQRQAADADRVLVMVDAGGDVALPSEADGVLSRKPVLVLNKIDRIRREELLALAEKLNGRFSFSATWMISAKTGDGVGDLLKSLAREVPSGAWLYPEDQAGDMPERLLAAEITREKAVILLRDELPYASAVETESWQVKPDGSVRLGQVVHVERESQKKIVLGKGGQMIRSIGTASRHELEKIFGRKVHLFLFVRVSKGWSNDPTRYRELGLDHPGGAS